MSRQLAVQDYKVAGDVVGDGSEGDSVVGGRRMLISGPMALRGISSLHVVI